MADPDAPTSSPRGLAWPILASALALAIGIWSLTRLSPTIDEWGYVQEGVKFWFGSDSRAMIRGGTLPLAFWIQNAPGALILWLKHGGLPGGLEGNFGKTLAVPDQLLVLFLARGVNLVLSGLGTIWMAWWLTRRHFGAVAAGASALCCAVEPNLLAGYVLATCDAIIVPPCLLMMILYEDHLQRPRPWKLLAVGGLYGLGIGFKVSVLPIGLLLIGACVLARIIGEPRGAVRALARAGLHAALFVVIGLAVSWAVNAFRWDQLLNPDSANQVAYKVAGRLGYRGEVADAWVGRLQRTWVPAPIGVFRYQVAHSRGGHPMTFLGRSGGHGPWYYYPYIFLMKTHLVLLVASAASLFRRSVWRSPVFLGALLMLALSLTSKVHGGPRYFLILYAFLASLAGVGVDWMLGLLPGWRSRWATAAALAAVALGLTLRSTPELLTHTSPLWGGDAQGYRYADANYDWGQGLYHAFEAADRAGLEPVAFFHIGDPDYGVPPGRAMIRGGDPRTIAAQMAGRYVVISVHHLYHGEASEPQLVPLQRALRAVGPDGRLTDTAFVFDFRAPDRYRRFARALDRPR